VSDRPGVFQDETRQELQRVFAEHVPAGGLHKVLDAGCGYKLPIDIPRSAHLSGIDNNDAALAKNPNADELILGDIQSYPLPADEYDAVICWWVLEHVPRPGDALVNLSSSLRPGGLLVLGIPHIYSMKAIFTKFTPYRFHVWVMRRFFGVANAGEPGVEPYPTFLRFQLAPARLRRLLSEQGLAPVYAVAHHSGDNDELPARLRGPWNAIARVLRACTLGRWDPHRDEYVAIFRKAPAPAAAPAELADAAV
jgi:SAM-dependent methyltransferase